MTVAPWTPEEVASLNDYQRRGPMHPFTCGRCRDNLGTLFVLRRLDGRHDPSRKFVVEDRRLVATEAGWVCETCDYTQNWAHDWMADRSWMAYDLPASFIELSERLEDGDHGRDP